MRAAVSLKKTHHKHEQRRATSNFTLRDNQIWECVSWDVPCLSKKKAQPQLFPVKNSRNLHFRHSPLFLLWLLIVGLISIAVRWTECQDHKNGELAEGNRFCVGEEFSFKLTFFGGFCGILNMLAFKIFNGTWR